MGDGEKEKQRQRQRQRQRNKYKEIKRDRDREEEKKGRVYAGEKERGTGQVKTTTPLCAGHLYRLPVLFPCTTIVLSAALVQGLPVGPPKGIEVRDFVLNSIFLEFL